MKMIIKLIIGCALCLAAVALLYFAGVLIYTTFTEFKPEPSEKLSSNPQKTATQIPLPAELNILTWNIGYGGLGKEMDFFYEGGKMVRPDEGLSQKYLKGIAEFLTANDSIDFFMLQEVDFDSRRSYYQNQAEVLTSAINKFGNSIAVNYQSDFVPVPFLEPMGKVNSGLMTLSGFTPSESIRISTPGSYSWPKRLFMLKRCLLITRFLLQNQKDLVMVNLHNSAFDDADALRDEELKLIKAFALEEFQKGNYLIFGGDWNQNPPGLKMHDSVPYKVKSLRPIPTDLMPDDWIWTFDNKLPTNRDVDKPFEATSTPCSLIDFFLVSPNIEVLETRTMNLEFENSDHLPVILKVRLKE